jgi:hypothetical protein
VLTEQALRTASEIYWEESLGKESLEKQMCRYICKSRSRLGGRSLLEAELKWARDHDQIQAQPCDTLVLPVGFSPEPLLQSICVYQPKKLILVLNQWYGEEEGGVFAGHLQEGIEYLEQQGLIDTLPEFINNPGYVLPQDDPASVFKTLISALHDVSDAAIDITGGKKSMVAGAFLYAAYAGMPISYVDFDKYHPEKRRPYGYSCRIGEITNPYQDFALREWERVRALYTDYKFREARKALEAMWPQVKGYFPDETGEGVQTMLNVFHCYEAWDAGDYNQAYVEAQKIPSFTPPDAVEKWGKNGEWVTTSGVEFRSVSRFYEDTDRFRAYVCDELARIRRLIECNEDYLSAFLRAGGLNEVVMVARLVRLVTDSGDKTVLLNALQDRTPNASALFKILLGGHDFEVGRDRNRNDISFPGAPNIRVSLSFPMNSWWTGTTTMFNANDGWGTFLKRRNDLTHQYYSPPPEWAEDALAFVTANAEDFFGRPVTDLNVTTEAISWGKLCTLSGMRCYLPPNLRKEARR